MIKRDIDIAKATRIKDIKEIAANIGLKESDINLFGNYIAKLPLRLINDKVINQKKLILVTAMTPTPTGEGKTTTSIGLTDGLNKIGAKTTVVLREPSLGPVFGIKGGAAGGGYSQVLPMEDINLHFTNDISAVEKTHNLLAALIDNEIYHNKKSLNIDPRKILWNRVIDMNERALRNIVIGLGGSTQGIPRESGFDITAASEIMAILCLAKDLDDLKEKFGNILIGFTFDKQPVYAHQLNSQGAMAALMKYAIMPNLVQTIEGNPAIIHGGPFANIAQGTNSLIATKMGLSLSDYVVTESGFASELGAEKFFDIKCQYGGLNPDATVLVSTIRALKYHGGVCKDDLNNPNPEAVSKGFQNLEKHIENIKHFNINPVVALNKFSADTDEEIEVLRKKCSELNIKMGVSDSWAKGGEGARELAELVKEEAENSSSKFKPLYNFEDSIKDKIQTIATKLYGADTIEYNAKAKRQIRQFKEIGLDKLPVCIAKTQNSLSDDPKKLNRPKDFYITIREFDIASGAGFIIPIAGSIMRMPGSPVTPAAENIDIDNEGNISGLF